MLLTVKLEKVSRFVRLKGSIGQSMLDGDKRYRSPPIVDRSQCPCRSLWNHHHRSIILIENILLNERFSLSQLP